MAEDIIRVHRKEHASMADEVAVSIHVVLKEDLHSKGFDTDSFRLI